MPEITEKLEQLFARLEAGALRSARLGPVPVMAIDLQEENRREF